LSRRRGRILPDATGRPGAPACRRMLAVRSSRVQDTSAGKIDRDRTTDKTHRRIDEYGSQDAKSELRRATEPATCAQNRSCRGRYGGTGGALHSQRGGGRDDGVEDPDLVAGGDGAADVQDLVRDEQGEDWGRGRAQAVRGEGK